MKENDAPKPILREDYRPLTYRVRHVVLTFELESESTVVSSELHIEKVEASSVASNSDNIFLDGVDLELLDIHKNGEQLGDLSLIHI